MMLDWFKKKQAFKPEPQAPISNDAAWANDSLIYSANDFTKYNPDDLIGIKGATIYKRMMRDEQVKAVVKFKRDAITSREYLFELDPEKSGLSEDETKRRINICNQMIENLKGSWMDVLNGVMSAQYNGMSISEKVYGQFDYEGRTYWGVDKVKLKPFDTFQFKTDEYGNVAAFMQHVNGQEQELDLRKFIHYVINPDMDEHYGQSDLRECYRAWFSKDTVIKFRNIYLERHAGGMIWAQMNDGESISPNSSEYTKLQNVLSNIQTATGVIVPSKYKLEHSYPSNKADFKEAIEDYNLDIAKALLVPNLMGITPAGQTGSYSQSSTQLEAFLMTTEADTSRLEDTLNEQLFRELGMANFGDDQFPKFKFKPVEGSRLIEIVTTWKDLVSSGAVLHTESDESHVRDLLKFPEASDPIETPTEPKPEESGDGMQEPEENPEDPPKTETPDETIRGKAVVEVSAFDRAVKRVDFAVIGKDSEDSVDDYTTEISLIMGQMYDELLGRVSEAYEGADEATVKKLKYDANLVRKLRRKVQRFMLDGWTLGQKHGSAEIDRAKGENFTADAKRLDFLQKELFDLQSFKITGDLTDNTIQIIRNDILNGAIYSKTLDDVVKTIYSDLASAGYLSIEDAKEALGQALGVDNPDARIRTVVRTNTFKSINEARYSYFTDPNLDNFVEALEYSAILDSRTTQVCEHLDGQIHAADSETWQNYTPPNHYNCRSLLIPVTELDQWSESESPTVDPQKGFA